MSEVTILRIPGGILAVVGFGFILSAPFVGLSMASMGLSLTTLGCSLLFIANTRARAKGDSER